MIISVEGIVARGKQLGRTIGFPTANIAASDIGELPQNGVYAAYVYLEGRDKPYKSVLNQGTHPTAPEGPPTIEAHILDFSEDIYGQAIRADYVEFLRPERKFGSLDELKGQIALDEKRARKILR
jgi:riboflavin kinase/FMN adenylyltransferase